MRYPSRTRMVLCYHLTQTIRPVAASTPDEKTHQHFECHVNAASIQNSSSVVKVRLFWVREQWRTECRRTVIWSVS